MKEAVIKNIFFQTPNLSRSTKKSMKRLKVPQGYDS